MGVARGEEKYPQPFEFGMGDDTLHQPFPQALVPVRLKDEYITQPGESGVIGHDTRKTHLFRTPVHAETERMFQRLLDGVQGTFLRPVEWFKKLWIEPGSSFDLSVLIT